jgi:hypothetical protein
VNFPIKGQDCSGRDRYFREKDTSDGGRIILEGKENYLFRERILTVGAEEFPKDREHTVRERMPTVGAEEFLKDRKLTATRYHKIPLLGAR